MSQVITNAFEQYWQSSLAAEQPVVLDEFILADIPDLDITSPIDPDTGLPPESQIVHRQNVDQRGRINNNAVAYTIVMDTTVGDFSFNAMYLRNKQNGVIGMIVYKGRETKLKTDQTTGQTGNSLVKSMLMGYDQAAEATLTHVDAGTWQIDYAARLRGQDEDLRQLASQLYGHHTFIGDGFKAVQEGATYKVTQGVAIVGGLRIELQQPEVIYPGTKPIGVWVDVYRSGSLLSEHQNHFTLITSVADLTDHVDGNGYQHYVAKLATVQADSSVVDGRGITRSGETSLPESLSLLEQADAMLAITSWEALRRSYAEAGHDLIGRFSNTGLKVNTATDVVLWEPTGVAYAYIGTLPHTIAANETPVGNPNWVDRSNAYTITVNSVSDLKNVSVLAGAALPSVRTLGHTMSGLGGGVYEYEYPTSKTDNGGSWIQSNALPGVWVLKSYCYAETFGVVPGSSDQSIRLQAYIDFCLANSVFSMAFEKPNAYTILNSVSFTQDPNTGNVQKPSLRRAFYFNGAVVYLGADNLKGFVVSRDFVTLVDPNIKTDKVGCAAVYNGLPVDDLSTAKRRSSQFMKLVRPCFEGVDVGVHFKPAATVSGQNWGAYYHYITDYALRNVNIGFLFDQCPTNDNATTRTGFSGGSHVGGSCTFLCLNAETITATGWSSEFLKRADSRLPGSEAVGVYMPPRNGGNTMDNGYSVFQGTVEASTNSHNIDGVYNDVEIVSIGITNPIDSGQVVGVDLIDTKHKTGSLAAATRATNPAKAPKLYLRRYIDSTPNGGSTFSVGENTSGGFDIYASGTTDNDISFSTGPVRVKNIGANIVTPNQIVLSPYKTVTAASLLMEFYGGRPIFRAADSGVAHFSGSAWSPFYDNGTDIGSPSNRVKQIYAVNGAINTSDANEKTDPQVIGDALLDAADDVQIILFKWLSAVREKGEDGARWHFGAIAQQVRDALAKHGVDGVEYGLLCYDKWDDSWEDVYEDVLDEDGNVVDVVKTGERRLVIPAGDRWGLRPDECHWWLLAAYRRRFERIELRLEQAGI